MNHPRTISFNDDWRFHRHDAPGAEARDFDDSEWRQLDLPHDYSIEGPFDTAIESGRMCGYRPLGIGWYRKAFRASEVGCGKRIWVMFEGVYNNADIWINGHHLGHRYNGYVSFWFDLTDHIQPGEMNTLAVRCDNNTANSSRWYTGSGIYRHVHLYVVDDLHVPIWGTSVTTPSVSASHAIVNVETLVRNAGTSRASFRIKTEIVASDGNIVAATETEARAEAGSELSLSHTLAVANPALWSPSSPALYEAVTTILSGEEIRDVVRTTFGIRSVKLTPDQGLLLNDAKLFLKGVCFHHDLGCLGAAAFDRGFERRLEILRDMGVNAIRLAHNPYSPAIMDLCDRMGFLVYHENFDRWDEQFSGCRIPFDKFWREDLHDTILRDRNHPSIFVWSVGNEVRQQLGENDTPDYGAALAREMVQFAHAADPTRPATVALYPARAEAIVDTSPRYVDAPPADIAFQVDMASFNYQEQFFDRDHRTYPGMIFCSSESVTGIGAAPWFLFDHSYAVGLFHWGAIEYIGEASEAFPKEKTWRYGILDLTCHRKGTYDPIATSFSERPIVLIAVDEGQDEGIRLADVLIKRSLLTAHWNWEMGSMKTVVAHSNSDEVELFFNGCSLGKKSAAESQQFAFRWEFPFEPGEILAIARNGGEEVARDTLRSADRATRIELHPDRTTLRADGQDLSHLAIRIVDDHGIVVPDASHQITFTVTGAGTNAGIDNGDNASDEPWQGNTRSAFRGRALLVVRSTRSAGAIVVRAEAAGLAAAEIDLIAR